MRENCECRGTGLVWLEDEDEWISCPNNCSIEEESDEDPLLNDKNLFPDEIPEENRNKWEREDE